MTDTMKILIGYDGSECSERMLWDLKRAGLPEKAEAIIISVAEHWLAAPTSYGGVDVYFKENPDEGEVVTARAEQAKALTSFYFPGWKISTEAVWGSPASKLIEKADEWKPDLIVVGSHGRNAVERIFLGSVSQKLVHEAKSSVRIARGAPKELEEPVRILIASDGSKGAAHAVDVVAARHWPPDSQVRLVNATWTVPPVAATHMVAPIASWINDENNRISEAMKEATGKLAKAGLSVTSIVAEEEPKTLICREAELWGADCIFVGARGMGTVERFMIGSISSGVAARAHCSVEVVRP